jgi:hypothetical protein
MTIISKSVLAISVCSFLTACGGGGGGGGPTVATSYPVQQALITASTNGLQATLNVSGTASNGTTAYPLTGSLTFTKGASTSGTFQGQSVLQSILTITGTLAVNGQSIALNSSETDYTNTSYQAIGYASTGNYCVATTPGTVPTTATAGQTGSLVTFNCYTDSTMTTSTGSQVDSYVTTAGSNGNLNFKILTDLYNTSNALTASGSTTYAITPAGVPSLVQVVLQETTNGVIINLTAQ